MDVAEVKMRVLKGVEALLSFDAELLEHDANERSITHRLAVHLAEEFAGWHVDCEYNRAGHRPKTLEIAPPDGSASDDEHATTVFPDIIIHQRGRSENLVVIEAKKTTHPQLRKGTEFDRAKLRAFASQLGYRATALLLLETRRGRDPSATVDFGDGPVEITRHASRA